MKKATRVFLVHDLYVMLYWSHEVMVIIKLAQRAAVYWVLIAQYDWSTILFAEDRGLEDEYRCGPM